MAFLTSVHRHTQTHINIHLYFLRLFKIIWILKEICVCRLMKNCFLSGEFNRIQHIWWTSWDGLTLRLGKSSFTSEAFFFFFFWIIISHALVKMGHLTTLVWYDRLLWDIDFIFFSGTKTRVADSCLYLTSNFSDPSSFYFSQSYRTSEFPTSTLHSDPHGNWLRKTFLVLTDHSCLGVLKLP